MERWFRILFQWFPVWAFAAWGWYGYSDTDHGFIQALAWRVANGQIPYLDFAMVRTPVSAYLHALPIWVFPDFLEIPMERLFALLQLQIICLFAVKWILADNARLHPAWMLIALLVSVHGYPVMAWHTIDGLMLISLGLFLWFGKSAPFVGLVMLWLAAGCKQVFLPVPLAATAMYLWTQRDWSAWCKAFVSPFPFLALLLLPEWIVTGNISQTIFYLTSAGSFDELISTGMIGWLPFLPAVFIGYFIRRYTGRQWVLSASAGLILLNVGYQMLRTLVTGTFSVFLPGVWTFALGLLCSMLFDHSGFRRQPIAIWIIAAWSASLSWGYPYPVLAAAPLVLWLGWRMETDMPVVPAFYRPLRTVLPLLFSILAVGAHFFPYRDTSALFNGVVSAPTRLQLIRIGKTNADKWAEAIRFNEKYPLNTILPSCPQWDYLLDRIPAYGCDWEHDVEIAWNKDSTRCKNSLLSSVKTVFLEKDKYLEWAGGSSYPSHLASWVHREWQIADSGTYFYVYEKNPSPVSASR